jgi:hypothetical protein
MPTNTPRLNLPKPLGTENVTRANYNALIDAIDANVPSLGTSDQSVNLTKSLTQQIDGRTIVLTYNATSGKLEKVEEKDGTTVVKTTTLNYDGSGVLQTVSEVAGGKTVTNTLNRDGNGKLTSVGRSVV